MNKKFLYSIYILLLGNARLKRLSGVLAPHLPKQGSILDLGCGNGNLAAAVKSRCPQLTFTGVDVMPQVGRPEIAFSIYDGAHVPYPDDSFDYVMLITVLHHTDDYQPLLREAKRLARHGVLVLDHQYTTRLDWLILACIDWPGNVPFGVYTPFNFKTRAQWQESFAAAELQEVWHSDRIAHFGKLLSPLIGRNLHFLSVLEPCGKNKQQDLQ